MVNRALRPKGVERGGMTSEDPETALALTYATEPGRAGLAALLALDDALGRLLRSTREPALGEIRLTWWRDRLAALDTAPPPGEPVLQALAAQVVARGVPGASLGGMTEGWALLLRPELSVEDLRRFGELRGGTLFTASAKLLGAEDKVEAAGQGWALADLSTHLSDPPAAAAARDLALPLLDAALAERWSRPARALGAMAHLARLDLARPGAAKGAPGRVGRLLWHRLTGR
jgi:15-cis-phytoene synthase